MRILAGLTLLASALLAQNVRITWVGQACYFIQAEEGGPIVVTDPPAANVGYTLPSTQVQVVTVSHNHTDHNNVAGLRGGPTVVDGVPVTARQEMTAAGLQFVLIPGFHDNTNGSARGRNTIIRWTQGGLRFAHFGDFGQDALTSAQLAELTDIDIAFIPGGGFFTPAASQMSEVIRQFRPRVAIMMHFRTALGGPAQLANFQGVAEPFPDVRYKPSAMLVSRATMPAESEVWIMEPDAEAAGVNGATFLRGMPVASGSIVSLFGSFNGAIPAAAQTRPFPRQLSNVEVQIGNTMAPLWYVSPAQVNLLVPSALTGAQVFEVRVGGQRVARGSLSILSSAPGLFFAVNQNGTINTPGNPTRRGQTIALFGTGQGPVSPPVEDGGAASAETLSRTPRLPDVYISGIRSEVTFSGLAPGLPGIWQIHAIVPDGALSGPNLGAIVNMGLWSNEIRVAIQ
jgi:uncharacterized protein (TIGR03437 family)